MRVAKAILPAPGVDEPDLVCIHLNREWIPVLLTALHRLEWAASWVAETDIDRAEQEVFKLYLLLKNADDDCCGDDQCYQFPPHASFIEWFPNNPYTEPDLVTEGYNQPAWYTATDLSNTLLGTQSGDVVTDLSRFPPGSLPTIIPASGLPRFRVNLNNPALVRLHLINILAGSIAQITVDDDTLSAQFIDLNKDVLAVPPETGDDSIVEIEVTGEGSHHIDVIIVSQVNDQIPFLHHGGGLRKVEICGEGAVEMPYFKLRQNPEDPCQLEQQLQPEGEWELAFDYGLCLPGAGVEQPTNEQYPPGGGKKQVSYDGGETWEDAPYDERFDGARPAPYSYSAAACLVAANVVAFLQALVNEIGTAIANGGTLIAIMGVVVSILALIFTVGAAIPLVLSLVGLMISLGTAGIVANFTEEFWEILECELLCLIPDDGIITEAVYNSIMAMASSRPGQAWAATVAMIAILGPVGLDRAGHAGGIAAGDEDCEDCGTCPDCNQPINMEYGTIIEVEAPGVYILESEAVSGSAVISYYYGDPAVNTDCCWIQSWENIVGYASTHHTARQVCGQDNKVNLQVLTNTSNHWVRWSRPTPDVMRVRVRLS